MTNIPVLELCKKAGCQCFTADVMQTSFQQVFNQIIETLRNKDGIEEDNVLDNAI